MWIDIGDRGARASMRETQGTGFTDTGTCAGDQGNMAVCIYIYLSFGDTDAVSMLWS